ncbi:MAG: cobaltochelatase subunit CobN [Deltaproteobacteria bacterium]|nr:MAG: cobaltochelatase subunit CobN [Deltaproteobacteria bacterium]
MNIVFVYGHMFNVQTWTRACAMLREDGIELVLFSQQQSAEKAMAFVENKSVDIFIGQFFHDLPCYAELLECSEKASMRVGLGWDMLPGFSTFSEEQVARFNQYLAKISVDNYVNGIKYLAACAGIDLAYNEPLPVQTHGLYHPEAPGLFSNAAGYHDWFVSRSGRGQGPVIGIPCYYGQIAEKNHDDIDAVIRAIESNGMIPLCVYSEGAQDAAVPLPERYPWLPYFKESAVSVSMGLSAIVNLMAGRLLSTPEDAFILQDLNVPVFQMVRLYHQSPDEWAKDSGGLGSGSLGMVYGLAQPEMAGVIEPTMTAGTIPKHDAAMDINIRRYVPVAERIDHLCKRLGRWIQLQTLPNSQKRVTIVLNNNPCKGAEATLGLAAGLDTFESLARFIRALKDAGYHVGDAPENGKAILDLFLERKAISEFRWTTVDEIVRKGGVLHRVDRVEYERMLECLPQAAKERILDDWGDFPGEGMVYRENGEPVLLVTGLIFGNLKLMIQPKRGCYGAKCNGEVCRILHDPELSPPHHWLAVYNYIQKTSDVVVHFGAHGALEFLPGKRAALSDGCFPEISLGDMPNVYLYVMDVSGDGIVAKRRGRAVMVDHLTPVHRPAVMDDDILALERLAEEYQSARDNKETKREAVVKDKMIPLMKSQNFVDATYGGEDFDEEAGLLARRIAQIRRTLAPSGMHVLGTHPDPDGIATMLSTILIKPTHEQPTLEKIAAVSGRTANNPFDDAKEVIRSVINDEPGAVSDSAEAELSKDFALWCRDIGGRINMSTREIPQLLRALNGEYIEPGLSGSLCLGKTQTLPTGRNFFTTDVQALPTRAAFEVGRELADNLIRKYIREENRFPESVGISLWSIDAFKSDGEMFCQILHLMGMRPVWDAAGRVSKIEAVPIEALSLLVDEKTISPRPRIDVVIQTSGILRDMVPHFADLVDEAAVLASRLDESHELNFIRKHTDERLAELKKELGEKVTESKMGRMASFRVFSSAPGTYGIGVGLALDASAWESEADLAETYVNWGGYAYGSDRAGDFSRISGQKARRLYAGNLKTIDVTYMRQYSPEYDLVDCGCYAGYLGGMSVAVKAVAGKSARVYWADTNAVGDLSVRDLKDDIEISVKAKLLNKNWIENQKKHGYKGAGGVSGRVNNLFKWSATTGKVEKCVFDKIVETYIRDRENLDWLRTENPYALEELTRRLLEAESRGLWEAFPDMLDDVRHAALLIEGDMEEIMGNVNEEFQGGKVDVLTAGDVDKWEPEWRLAFDK